jgi:hypothetical protein
MTNPDQPIKSAAQRAMENLQAKAAANEAASEATIDSGIGSAPTSSSGSSGIPSGLQHLRKKYDDTIVSLSNGSVTQQAANQTLEALTVQDANGWQWGVDADGNFRRRNLALPNEGAWELAAPHLFALPDDMGHTDIGVRVTHEEKAPSAVSSAAANASSVLKSGASKVFKERPAREEKQQAKAAKSVAKQQATEAAPPKPKRDFSMPELNLSSMLFIAIGVVVAIVTVMSLRGSDEVVAPQDGVTTTEVATESDGTISVSDAVDGKPDPREDVEPFIAALTSSSLSNMVPADTAFPDNRYSDNERAMTVALWSYFHDNGATYSVGEFSSTDTRVTSEVIISVGENQFTSEITWVKDRDSNTWRTSGWPVVSAVR